MVKTKLNTAVFKSRLTQTILLVSVFLLPFAGSAATVLFDEGHAQAFLISKAGKLDLSEFAQIITDSGNQVQSVKHPLTPKVLAQVDALIISGPFKAFSQKELTSIKSFVQSGGKLVVLIHIAPTVGGLLAHFEVKVSNYVINEKQDLIENSTKNFKVTNLSKHQLFKGIDNFNLYGGWALKGTNANTQSLAQSSHQAWLDLNRNKQQDPQDFNLTADVVLHSNVGHGEILIFADDAIFQNQFMQGNNKKLAENLALWLTKKLSVPDVKHFPSQTTD